MLIDLGDLLLIQGISCFDQLEIQKRIILLYIELIIFKNYDFI